MLKPAPIPKPRKIASRFRSSRPKGSNARISRESDKKPLFIATTRNPNGMDSNPQTMENSRMAYCSLLFPSFPSSLSNRQSGITQEQTKRTVPCREWTTCTVPYREWTPQETFHDRPHSLSYPECAPNLLLFQGMSSISDANSLSVSFLCAFCGANSGLAGASLEASRIYSVKSP